MKIPNIIRTEVYILLQKSDLYPESNEGAIKEYFKRK